MTIWRAWADAIFERYLRRPVRAGATERVLARPISLVRERWLVALRTMLPQIRLAIQPLLRPHVWHPPARIAMSPGAPQRPERITERVVSRHETLERRFTRAETVLARHLDSTPHAPPLGSALPLQLVFQRLREPERALNARPAPRPEDQAAVRAEVARHVGERSRRLEIAPADAPMRIVGRPGGDAVSDAPRRRGAGAGDSSAPWEQAEQSRSNGSRARIADQQAQVNVAALADRVMQQIDDRLHAWRERTGF